MKNNLKTKGLNDWDKWTPQKPDPRVKYLDQKKIDFLQWGITSCNVGGSSTMNVLNKNK